MDHSNVKQTFCQKKKKHLKYGWAIFYLLSSPCLPSEKMWDRTVPKGRIVGLRKVWEEKPYLLNGY